MYHMNSEEKLFNKGYVFKGVSRLFRNVEKFCDTHKRYRYSVYIFSAVFDYCSIPTEN